MGTKQATMDPRVDVYVEGAPEFARPVLRHLRGLIHAACAEVEETIKWGRPFFLYRGKMVCAMASFTAHCSFRLWGAEMAGALRDAGVVAEDAAGSFGRITRLEDLPEDRLLRGWLRQAFELAAGGKQAAPTRVREKAMGAKKAPPAPPEDLTAELGKRVGATALFDALSPSCRREYIEWIEEAKRVETRRKRVVEAVGWIAEGKRRNWKYEAS